MPLNKIEVEALTAKLAQLGAEAIQRQGANDSLAYTQYERDVLTGALPVIASAVLDAAKNYVNAVLENAVPRMAALHDEQLAKHAEILAQMVIKNAAGRGEQGPAGPIGPMPKHEWSGTRLRFELDIGIWGEWVDLEGPRGPPGPAATAGLSAMGIPIFGGPGGAPARVNSYFPSGW